MNIHSANSSGGNNTSAPERNILTPLPPFVETMPISKAVASGNGNKEFYKEITRSNLK
jgi:hypothetical protein